MLKLVFDGLEYVHWTTSDWERVLWSDEPPFEPIGKKTRDIVIRRDDEKLHPDCVQKTVKFSGSKLMLWRFFKLVELTRLFEFMVA